MSLTPEQRRKRDRAYYARTREKQLARQRAYREANPMKAAGWQKVYYDKNPEKRREASQRIREASPEKARQQSIAWREKNPARARANCRLSAHRWRENNPEKKREEAAERRRIEARRTPAWADLAEIKQTYLDAARKTLETGVLHEVDHIYPLRGKTVSGLHVPDNLRVVHWLENRRKGNQ
jgi:hypothetical protein